MKLMNTASVGREQLVAFMWFLLRFYCIRQNVQAIEWYDLMRLGKG